MKQLIEYTMDDGTSMFVEVIDSNEMEATRGGFDMDRNITTTATKKLEDALQPLKGFSNYLINTLKEMVKVPDETVIEMGLKFSAKAGIILTSVDSEVNLKVTLTWKK